MPQISEPISSQVLQWDQIIQLSDMKSEWQKLLQTIGDKIKSQVYKPLEKFNIDKILHGGDSGTSEVPRANIECLKQLEFAIRAWTEQHRRRLFLKNGLNDKDGFIEYTRAAFIECLESVIHSFQEQWTIKLDKCFHDTKNHLTTNSVLKRRTIKAPIDTSEQHSQLAKIVNMRGDPEVLSKIQTNIYDICIDQLTRELKAGVPFAQIQLQMNPVKIEPYLNQLWDETVKFYKSLQVQPLFLQKLDKLYDQIKPIWASLPVIFELIKIMDHSFRINQWISFFANVPTSRHDKIFGEMRATIEPYASHKIVMEKYIEIHFPQILETWAREDIQSITSDDHLTKITNHFQQFFDVYVSKFRNDLNNMDNLSWLSRSLVILQRQDGLR